ncbi:MAG TPA: DUF305 domain-containing protein [Candidatus Paceibacterota bacterium]
MKTNVILIAAVALLLGGIGGYFFSKSERYETMMGVRDSEREVITPRNDAGMHGMHGMNTNMSEKEFIESMIPHHQEAVDTAKQVLARGATTPEIKTLVEGIITAQEKEIADMQRWYKEWYGVDYKNAETYQPMMQDLSILSGEELDRVFLQDMIMHHMGALMMAQHVAVNIQHEEMQALAENIAETQSAEIITMRMILKKM